MFLEPVVHPSLRSSELTSVCWHPRFGAKLVREGKLERARQGRAKLFTMLNQLGVMEERASPLAGELSG